MILAFLTYREQNRKRHKSLKPLVKRLEMRLLDLLERKKIISWSDRNAISGVPDLLDKLERQKAISWSDKSRVNDINSLLDLLEMKNLISWSEKNSVDSF